MNASSLRKRLTHECCINEGVSQSQSYVGKSVVSLLSIPTMGEGEGQDPTLSIINIHHSSTLTCKAVHVDLCRYFTLDFGLYLL